MQLRPVGVSVQSLKQSKVSALTEDNQAERLWKKMLNPEELCIHHTFGGYCVKFIRKKPEYNYADIRLCKGKCSYWER
jgi:hypothetical protein